MTDWTPERIGRLTDAYGGPFALARELGINDETLRLWRRGQRNPGGSAKKLMDILEKRARAKERLPGESS